MNINEMRFLQSIEKADIYEKLTMDMVDVVIKTRGHENGDTINFIKLVEELNAKNQLELEFRKICEMFVGIIINQ